MGSIQRRIIHGVIAVVEHPKTTLAIAAVALVACVALAWTSLRISTDQDKLFDSHISFFHNYLQFVKAFPENEAMYVVVRATHPRHVPPAGQWIRLARALAHGIAALHQDVSHVDSHIPLHQLGNQGLLFASWPRVKKEAAAAGQFVGIARTLGQKAPAWQGFLGATRIERYFRSTAGVRIPGAAGLTTLLANSLNAALQTPMKKWTPGRQIPDLNKLSARAPTPDDFGYYYIRSEKNPRHHLLLIKVYEKREYHSLAALTRPLRHIRAVIARVAAPYRAVFKVGVTGRPALDADEMTTTNHDTHWAETLAMCVIFLGLIIMLRSVWLAVVAEITLATAIGWTFGWATISVGKLNLLSTVFVIAMIGIGMDYLIQILVRYRREAKRYVRPHAVWTRVFRYAGPPIITACCGAAGAFFVAVFTEFTGAAQLGIIAGGGLLLCLLAGYTVLPAILVLLPARIKMLDAADRYHGDRAKPRAGWWKFLLPGAWLLGLAAISPFMMNAGFNSNLLSLQAPGLKSVRLVSRLPTWYAVALSRHLTKLLPLEKKLWRLAQRPDSVVARVSGFPTAMAKQRYLARHTVALRAVHWQTPGSVNVAALASLRQGAKSAALVWRRAEERALPKRNPGVVSPATRPSGKSVGDRAPPVALALNALSGTLARISKQHPHAAVSRLNAWQRALVDNLRADAHMLLPGPLHINQLPGALRQHFIGRNGRYALYIYPRYNLWKQHNLRAFVQQLEGTKRSPALVAHNILLTGISVQLYHSTQAIKAAFLHSTLYALALVIALVLLDLRRVGHTFMAISVLAFGLPMLAGIMGVLHIQWNFANFFGLPILIGAGHEYGVFMVHRYKEVLHDPRRAWYFWDPSDRALLLCAFVTASSFGFLAFAQHRGIASLGLVMFLGTICIYLATICVLRPLLQWRLHDKNVYAIL